MVATPTLIPEFGQTWSFRGSKSRNKVSVGEPAEGSLPNDSLDSVSSFLMRCKPNREVVG